MNFTFRLPLFYFNLIRARPTVVLTMLEFTQLQTYPVYKLGVRGSIQPTQQYDYFLYF